MGDTIISFFINGLVALIMIVIGISMIVKKTPTGFYTGEDSHKPEEITNVKKWNLIHGLMFVIYGILIITACIVLYYVESLKIALCIYFGVYLLPLIFMIIIHTYLEKHYVIN